MGRRTAFVTIVSAAVLAASAFSTPASAVNGVEPEVVASNLNSPRGLSFAPNGDLYIAESGVPGVIPGGACFVHPQFGPTCVGDSGSITLLSKHGAQSRVLAGLPTAVNAAEANGPFDVVLHGNTLTIPIGLGGSLENRDELGPDGALLGTVIDAKRTGKGTAISLRADLLQYEADHNPAGGTIDSNPVHVAFDGRDLVAVDAGGNTVLQVDKKGGVSSLLAVLDPVIVPAPPDFLGLPPNFPAQPVPTSAVQGPDGAWYISQLTGFPFPAGQSTIFRLANGQLEPYATGLTTVTDLAWDGGDLYAVQITNDGLGILSGTLNGSLVRVDPIAGNHETVANLNAPYGVAINRGYAYVTVDSTGTGGAVVKIPLS